MIITLSCCLCSEELEVETKSPVGWAECDDIYEEAALCPKHAKIAEFIGAQCPGCVSGWKECGLFEAFAYSKSSRTISEKELTTIENGICPYRVNGSLMITNTPKEFKMEKLDLSEQASHEAGNALAQAIREYMSFYS